jgi:hypothetical protein
MDTLDVCWGRYVQRQMCKSTDVSHAVTSAKTTQVDGFCSCVVPIEPGMNPTPLDPDLNDTPRVNPAGKPFPRSLQGLANGRCGVGFGDSLCPHGLCCSEYGWVRTPLNLPWRLADDHINSVETQVCIVASDANQTAPGIEKGETPCPKPRNLITSTLDDAELNSKALPAILKANSEGVAGKKN